MYDRMTRKPAQIAAGIALVVMLALTAGAFALDQASPGSPATAPSTQPAKPTSVPADTATPRGTMKLLFAALSKGDGDAIRKLIEVNTPLEQRMVDALVPTVAADAETLAQIETATLSIVRFIGSDPFEVVQRIVRGFLPSSKAACSRRGARGGPLLSGLRSAKCRRPSPRSWRAATRSRSAFLCRCCRR
jgi:hypothetical protein